MRLRRSGPTAVLGGVSMRRWVVLGCAVLCSSRRADGLAACRSASSRDDGEGEGAGGGRGGSGICMPWRWLARVRRARQRPRRGRVSRRRYHEGV
jgi:hypothetical protein